MKIENPELFQLHSEYCRVLANDRRLMILALLKQGEMSVGEIAAGIGASLAATSQHLGILRNRRIVEARKEGQTVYYRPTDPRLMEACTLIRTILLDGMRKRGELAREMNPDGLTSDED